MAAAYQLVYGMCEYRKDLLNTWSLKTRARLLNAFFSHILHAHTYIILYMYTQFLLSVSFYITTVLRRGNPKPYDRYNIPDMWSKHIYTHILHTGPIDLWPRGRPYAAATTGLLRRICRLLLYIDSDRL